MPKLNDLCDTFLTAERPVGAIVEDEQALALLAAAVSMYAAYGELSAHRAQRLKWEDERARGLCTPRYVPAEINGELELSAGEVGVVRPLWMLYMEREVSRMTESTRIMGDLSFGRSSSEVQQDITLYESEMHMKAFCYEAITV